MSRVEQVRPHHSPLLTPFAAFLREPKVVETFQELWNTDELLVSFDAMYASMTKRRPRVESLTLCGPRRNFSLPIGPHARRDIEPSAPWQHIDQQPDPTE